VSIVIPADAGVDVLLDNTSHLAVSPPTTPPHQHQRRTHPGTQEHRTARRIVRDNIDTLDHHPHARVMQKTNKHPNYQGGDVEPRRGVVVLVIIYVDGRPVPVSAYGQVVFESLLQSLHDIVCPCAGPVITHRHQQEP
jgi:hypothetical protein